MNITAIEATAYHEAGHAVVALALGRLIHRVSIRPTAEFLGICEFRKGAARPSDDWLEQEVLISLAGLAAEARRTGTYDRRAAGRDLRTVQKLARNRVGERGLERYERRMLSKAEFILADDGHWAAVTAIAAAVLKSETISGRAARHLFDEAVARTAE